MHTQAILRALLEDAGAPHFGLEMARAAGLPSGTIYPILAGLERAGWVESCLEDIDPQVAGRRPRRYYKLSAEGERVATTETAGPAGGLGALSVRAGRTDRELRMPRRPGVLPT